MQLVRDLLKREENGLPEGRTPREIEVLRLVAAGKSNRQIAGELKISINTADRHVSTILTKVSSSNRAEAASFAVRHRLASERHNRPGATATPTKRRRHDWPVSSRHEGAPRMP